MSYMTIRSRISNLTIALGFVLIYYAVSSITVDVKHSLNAAGELAAREKSTSLPKGVPSPAPILDSIPASLLEPSEKVKPVEIIPPKEELPTPTPAGPEVPEIPVRVVIPAIQLDAPIALAKTKIVKVAGKDVLQWKVPDEFAAGWHETSARLGEPGNTVLNGHHNIYGEVFGHLVDLNVGELVQVYSETSVYTYRITNKMILPEKYEQLDVRMENAQWILPSEDERLTLITCWPHESNTHRLIIVAEPVSYEKLAVDAP